MNQLFPITPVHIQLVIIKTLLVMPKRLRFESDSKSAVDHFICVVSVFSIL